jgi:hypothetical protein
MRGWKALWFAGCVALGWAPEAVAAPPTGWGIGPLMQSMARIRSACASFTETRTLPMLTAPLLASGSLDYVAPDYIRKRTTAPVREDFVLRGDEITLTGGPGNQTHRFSLGQAPGFGELAEGIRATLAGDLPALQQSFVTSLSGAPSGWQLVLQPKDAQARHFIAWIAIRGDGNAISSVDTASGDGGHSEMRITEDHMNAG